MNADGGQGEYVDIEARVGGAGRPSTGQAGRQMRHYYTKPVETGLL